MKLTNFRNACLAATVCIFGLTACDSSDNHATDKTDNSAVTDSGTRSAAKAGDSSGATAKTNSAAPARRKGKATVTMPQNSQDKMIKDKEGIYNTVQEMPVYPGGQDALASYVNDHLDYTQQAIDNNTAGTVKISFVVDENGKVTRAHLIGNDRLGNGLDEQALKVVNAMPAWTPGKMHGKKVKTRLELPITFQLES